MEKSSHTVGLPDGRSQADQQERLQILTVVWVYFWRANRPVPWFKALLPGVWPTNNIGDIQEFWEKVKDFWQGEVMTTEMKMGRTSCVCKEFGAARWISKLQTQRLHFPI